MLDPKGHIVFLPQDREIMDITGMSEQEYRWFVKQAFLHSKLRPGEPTNFFPVIPFLIKLAIGVALSFAASLLLREDGNEPDQTPEKRVGGQDFVSGQRSAPTSAFDSVQNVVELGSTVPLVYANRRKVGGKAYGGVRVNTNLLWSQLQSIGTGQFLRAIFLVSEGVIPELNPEQFAIGNNLLRNFDLQPSDTSRVSIYYADGSRVSNRIVGTDNIAGRLPDSDIGNAENAGGLDVFEARRPGVNQWAPDFVFTSTPSNQTTFGVSGFIGNNMPFKLSPQIKPTENFDNQPQKEDSQAKSDRERDNWRYYSRAGIHEINGNPVNNKGLKDLEVGDLVRYTIFKESDFDGQFQFQVSGADGFTSTSNVATSIASRQNNYDDQIALGDKYLLGTAQGICVERSANAFQSETANIPVGGGLDVTAVFKITKAGVCDAWIEAELNPPLGEIPDNQNDKFVGDKYPALVTENVTGTRKSHILRLAEGFFSTERRTRYIEVGLRSVVNLQLNNLCFFRNVRRGDQVRRLNEIDTDKTDKNITYINDRITTPEQRISSFRVGYRKESMSEYTFFPFIFCIRSLTQDAVFNYLRFEFPEEAIYEFKFTPISGYELRWSDDVIQLLDYKSDNRVTVTDNGVNIIFTGEADFQRIESNFSIAALTTIDGAKIGDDSGIGIQFDDNIRGGGTDYFADAYPRVAEAFLFDEIQASTGQPEHQIVYVNTQTENTVTPDYANLALVGLNIRSSTEITQLQQFSVYCEKGIGATNKFPEVLLDLLTNKRYGVGAILNRQQIDEDSFDLAADFCEDRLYFFDGIIDQKLNIRSWAAQTARAFLLDFVIRNGKFALQPAVNLPPRGGIPQPETITGLYTAGNIIDESFDLSFIDEQQRIPPRVQVRWRDEKGNLDSVTTLPIEGNFPVIRQVTVKEKNTPDDAPLEQIDATAFATSQEHAIDVAKFTCRSKRLVTHTVRFRTTPPESSLDIGSVFKLGLETVNYDQPQNGAITSTGEVTAWPPLDDGTYDVLLWDGTNLQETTIKITDGKSFPRGSVFCLRDTTVQAGTYKTQSLSFDEEGNIQVEASFFPTTDSGVSLIADGFDDRSNWDIEGEII